MDTQKIISGLGRASKLQNAIQKCGMEKYMLVCGNSFDNLPIVSELNGGYIRYSNFQKNPTYKDIQRGIDLFNSSGCDGIVSVGGGSAIDVAKCVKLYCKSDMNQDLLKSRLTPNNIKHIAVPTTAGTGSESTSFAVVYRDGMKYSVTDMSLLPNVAILDGSLLVNLPEYHKKSTFLDALCQAVEAILSVRRTELSTEYACKAIDQILTYKDGYFSGNTENAQYILMAANYSGKAINISKTTAAHAMSYKLTKLYGIAHGHAVAICLPYTLEYLYGHDIPETQKLCECFGLNNFKEVIKKLRKIIAAMQLPIPKLRSEWDLKLLAGSVNMQRLGNFPIELSVEDIEEIYSRALLR